MVVEDGGSTARFDSMEKPFNPLRPDSGRRAFPLLRIEAFLQRVQEGGGTLPPRRILVVGALALLHALLILTVV